MLIEGELDGGWLLLNEYQTSDDWLMRAPAWQVAVEPNGKALVLWRRGHGDEGGPKTWTMV